MLSKTIRRRNVSSNWSRLNLESRTLAILLRYSRNRKSFDRASIDLRDGTRARAMQTPSIRSFEFASDSSHVRYLRRIFRYVASIDGTKSQRNRQQTFRSIPKRLSKYEEVVGIDTSDDRIRNTCKLGRWENSQRRRDICG